MSWNEGFAFPLVIVSGPESYLASRAISGIRRRMLTDNPGLEISEVLEGEYASGLLLSLASPSLFGDERLVIVYGAPEDLAADADQYLQEPSSTCTVIVRLPNLVGHNGKFKTAFSKRALNIACEELKKDTEKLDFIRGEFKDSGVTIDAPGAKLLLQAFNSDLGELGAACSQLSSMGKPSIGHSDVEGIFSGRLETNAFKIADAAMSGNAAEAIRLFRHGSATGIDHVPLVAALTMRIRQLARLFNDRNANPSLLGMAPWQIDKAKRELSGWSEGDLVELVQLAAQTDADVKGAARDPDYSIEKLLLAMARSTK